VTFQARETLGEALDSLLESLDTCLEPVDPRLHAINPRFDSVQPHVQVAVLSADRHQDRYGCANDSPELGAHARSISC